jgi:hypothetical protein
MPAKLTLDENYYDKTGNPISIDEWSVIFKDMEYKRVRLSKGNGSTVSTVWLGLDHSYGDEPLKIFETLVQSGPLADEMWRYSTLEEAIEGHEHVVRLIMDVYGL